MEPLNTLIATSHGLANFEPRRLQFKVVEPDAWGMGEVFQVDDLLDFSNDDIGGPIGDDCTSLSEHTNDSSLTEAETFTSPWTEKCCTQATDAQHQEIGQPSGVELCLRPPSAQQLDIGQPSGGELCVPPDELADQLEWLSTFVEDSYSSDKSLAPLFSLGPLTLINEKRSDFSNMKDSFQSSSPVSVVEESQNYTRRRCSFSPTMFVPGRARSKRSRTGGRVWSLHSLVPGLTENRDEARNTVFFETSGDCQGSSSEQEMDDSMRLAKKANKSKQVKKNCDASLPRRCTHCLVQKTPQWRAGPMGAKTLCNACGVRYKSGRLVPEYRPAGSPSFVSEVHSNSHKKILEMRRYKEQEVSQQPESDMSQEVSTQESNTRNSREDIEASIISDVVSNLRTEQ